MLFDFIQQLQQQHQKNHHPMPDCRHAGMFIDELISLLFPADVLPPKDYYGLAFKQLQLQLERLLTPLANQLTDSVSSTVRHFFDHIPQIYQTLLEDADAIYRFDPAAKSLQEVIAAYPGFYGIAVYRLSNYLYRLQVPILPRIISEYAHSRTGIDIHPGATIGKFFFMDHATGIVIGETTHIGDNVKLYQGVTLGALYVEKSLAQSKRHPTLEDNVIIYAGSTVLGGNTVVGHDTIIGGNVFLTESVAPYSVVYHKSEIKIRQSKVYDEPINFII